MTRKTKRYTVNTVTPNSEGKTYNVFNSLPKARAFGNEMKRANNFASLLNFKRVSLSL
tara:strand:- start:692 stop:865 length:174 start_codon:yes stop_codon:yes gene_type:complete